MGGEGVTLDSHDIYSFEYRQLPYFSRQMAPFLSPNIKEPLYSTNDPRPPVVRHSVQDLQNAAAEDKILTNLTLPETNIAPARKPFQRKLVFQPSIFRCYVSFREGRDFDLR